MDKLLLNYELHSTFFVDAATVHYAKENHQSGRNQVYLYRANVFVPQKNTTITTVSIIKIAPTNEL